MSVKFNSYNDGKTVKALSERLGWRLLKRKDSKFSPSEKDLIINWGASKLYVDRKTARVLNAPEKLDKTINKLFFFRYATTSPELNVPTFFTDKATARRFLDQNPDALLVARTILTGHEGNGIVLCGSKDDLPDCKLYTVYVKKKAEYRVHIFNGAVIDVIQKKRKRSSEGDSRIRNTANGYVFCRLDIYTPPGVLSQASISMKHFGLDFGAADVLWNEHQQNAYVLEINSAPGLEGTTLDKYVEAFQGYAKDYAFKAPEKPVQGDAGRGPGGG